MKYIVLKCIEGFGDRLQVLLQAIEYCKITKRILVSDWNDYMWGDGFTSFEYYFRIRGIETIKLNKFKEIFSQNMSLIPKVWRNELFKPADLRVYSSEFLLKDENGIINDICNGKLDFQEDIVVLSGIKNRTFIYKNFVHLDFSNKLKNRIQDTDIYKKLNNIKYLAIHLRGGDRIGHNDKRFDNGSINTDDYINKILSKTSTAVRKRKITNILIVSDTQHLINLFREQLKKFKNLKIYGSNNFLLNNENTKTGLHKLPFKTRSKKKITKKKINFFTLLDFFLLLNSVEIINDTQSIFSNIAKSIKLNSRAPYLDLHQNLKTININLSKINHPKFYKSSDYKDLYLYEGTKGKIFMDPRIEKGKYMFCISYVSNDSRPTILKIGGFLKKITKENTGTFNDLGRLYYEKVGPVIINKNTDISLKAIKYFPHIFKIWLEPKN